MRLKIEIVLLLLSSIVSSISNGQALKGYKPSQCNQTCVCYYPNAIDKIADELDYAEMCRYTLKEYETFAASNNTTAQNLEWWQEPSIVIGSVVLSASLFGTLGFLLGNR